MRRELGHGRRRLLYQHDDCQASGPHEAHWASGTKLEYQRPATPQELGARNDASALMHGATSAKANTEDQTVAEPAFINAVRLKTPAVIAGGPCIGFAGTDLRRFDFQSTWVMLAAQPHEVHRLYMHAGFETSCPKQAA